MVARHGLPAERAGQLAGLLSALAAETDPPTTIREPDEAVALHVADSLSGLEVAPLRTARRIADLGAGAGFPGLPLAVALPEARVDLIESRRRNCAVIEALAAAAGISNASAVGSRAEDWAAKPPPEGGREAYEAVTARALAELAVLVEYAAPLLAQSGVLVAWKGARQADEERRGREAAGQVGLELEEVRPVQPFEGSENRHLYVLRKHAATPDRFPRRPGMALKRPLA